MSNDVRSQIKASLNAYCTNVFGSHTTAEPYLDVFATDIEQLIQQSNREAEGQARANALYEASCLVSDDPQMYKRLLDRREEILAHLQHPEGREDA